VFIAQLTSGATGEELGWRGYLLAEFQKRHSILVSALLVGIIWGLWHFPVWFTLGYAGSDLIRYIGFFLVQIISVSVVMAVFYIRQKNLLIPIWIHFLTNFLAGLVKVELLNLIGWLALGYAVWAIIMALIERKRVFKLNMGTKSEVVR
jgi:membrane protease YdiL (CAAX protease family)